MLSARLMLSWPVALVIGLTLSSDSYAEERRCRELGENCVCSEPLNGTLRRIGTWYNPNDSETKECTVDNTSDPALRGVALTRNADDLRPTNESFILGALPAGHKISSVVRAPEGYSGLWFLGHYFGDEQRFLKRLAVRWYRYYSSNYEMSPADNPACDQRGKITEAHVNYTSVGNGFTAYNFLNWTPNGRDCCGYVQTSDPTIRQLRGKWVRFEYMMINRNGPGHNSLLYVKNVTDDSPEQLVFDFSRLSFWSPRFTPPSPVRFLRASQYAQGTCAGFAAVSHFMSAGWDTDTGQRIGPAYEIEGGGSRGKRPPRKPDTRPLAPRH
jgi:hypothetical protein